MYDFASLLVFDPDTAPWLYARRNQSARGEGSACQPATFTLHGLT